MKEHVLRLTIRCNRGYAVNDISKAVTNLILDIGHMGHITYIHTLEDTINEKAKKKNKS